MSTRQRDILAAAVEAVAGNCPVGKSGVGGQRRTVSIANGYWMMLDASQAISAEHRGPDGYTLDVLDFTE